MTTGEPCPGPFADNIKPYQALLNASSNVLIDKPVLVVIISLVFYKDFVECYLQAKHV